MHLVRQGAQNEPSVLVSESTEDSGESKESNDEPSSDTTEEAEIVETTVSATLTQNPDDQASDSKVKHLMKLHFS